ncbi:sensor histidine kinase [Calycomorphotria hydatis]|uniref:histidine kinase n=1 Tax=Calycomorphotria hydatis TaxID=2528027 RepID=A0A517TAQ5_9PLAN|nr:HAMP domain-containing sensor histidine kinase [Calycomorphotria hydatis]QDT65457.1 Sensor protein ZraS [Calycomorphotria hydatis]
MLFGRSIRRKMIFGLGLLMVLIGASSLSGMLSLRWYHEAVQDLDFTLNRMPRRAELDAAVGQLFEPLVEELPEVMADLEYQHRHARFSERLFSARASVREFWTRFDSLPPDQFVMQQRTAVDTKVGRMDQRLAYLHRLNDLLTTAEYPQAVLQAMIKEVAQLERDVQSVPDPQRGMSATVEKAVHGFSSRIRSVILTTVLAVGLFIGLVWYFHHQIFVPLRKLHKGARRVAQGDFDYRVKMASNDEFGELAEAFNRMTDRFQEITSDLDNQVQERSQQLVRSERLAGIGFLSAGVAHEINNPLSAIAMAAESLESRLLEMLADGSEADRSLAKQYLGMIQRESFRCQTITRRMLDFARGSGSTREMADINRLVGEVLEMVSHMSRFKDRTIIFDPTGGITAEVNGAEIKQVILNLVANALQAMEPGQTLKIDISQQTDGVLMTFADNGAGMCEETRAHLFEPFFTRRADGKGTGLGMSITHRIVTEHGGTIEAHSKGKGCGSTFKVRLPRKARQPAKAA